jgi:hypothetical protein
MRDAMPTPVRNDAHALESWVESIGPWLSRRQVALDEIRGLVPECAPAWKGALAGIYGELGFDTFSRVDDVLNDRTERTEQVRVWLLRSYRFGTRAALRECAAWEPVIGLEQWPTRCREHAASLRE